MLLNSNDKSVILSSELNRHNMKKYEFKKLDINEISEIKQKKPEEVESSAPTSNQISMIQSSLEKELIEKLLAKIDDLSSSVNSLQAELKSAQAESSEREKNARLEGIKEGEMKTRLALKEESEKERERFAKSIARLDDTIEDKKSQIVKLESELSAIALDIAKEVIIKEVSESSAKIAASISRELLRNMSGNLNIIIKVNPLDFEFLNGLIKNRENIKVKSDEAIAKGGVVIISDNGNVDGNVMSRYQLLKQSVLENFRP